MKAKFKKFIESIGFTKAQFITVFLCYFLCFALFLGIVVIWDPKSKVVDATVPTAPTINADEDWTQHHANSFGSGTGTSSDPYIITSAQELAYLAYSVNNGTNYSGKYFKQINNIDLSAYTWVAIGDFSTNPFCGSYDGGNYLIEGMFSRGGLFGYITYSTERQIIENIILQNSISEWGICFEATGGPSLDNALYFRNCVVDVTFSFETVKYNFGAIACASHGTVWYQYCANLSKITQTSITNVGGIVGVVTDGIFSGCVNLGDIQGESSIGGIAGGYSSASSGALFVGCVNKGNINGDNYVGGIIGSSYYTTFSSVSNYGVIEGSSDVGGIAGNVLDLFIVINSINFGDVSGWEDCVGGLFGRISGGGSYTVGIGQCYNYGDVTVGGSGSYVGGLIGELSSSGVNLSDCFNVGDVQSSSTQCVGGIIGEVACSSGNTNISRVYNNGKVTGSSYVGGLIGMLSVYGTGKANISHCYAGAGTTTGSNSVGPVFGTVSGSISVANVYYFEDKTSAYGTRETNSLLDTICTLSWYSNMGWDFSNWVLDNEGSTLPRLKLFYGYYDYDTSWYNESGGSSNSNPYLISDISDVWGMMYLNVEEGLDFSGKYFKQTADIDFRFLDENSYSGGSYDMLYISLACPPYVGIGQRSLSFYTSNNFASLSSRSFAGNYDGNGYSFLGVISNGAGTEQGIFGYVTGTVKNLTVKESYIIGNSYVGGIAGYCTGTISECVNQAYVAGSSYVGGIAGCASGTVTNCYNTGQVVGGSYVGGIAGYLGDNGSNINRCYNNGSVTGSSDVGGIVGRMNSYNLTSDAHVYIYNSINLGRVNGAGIVGRMRLGYAAWGVDNYAYVYNCYNLGYATGNAIVGTQERGTGSSTRYHFTVSGCYFGANYGRTTTSYGGSYNSSLTMGTPKSSSWFTNSSNWNSSYPWDFTNTWTIDPSKNNSYPILRNAQAEQPIAYWTDFGNYSIEWYTSSDTVTYGDGSASNPYKISTAEDLAGLSYLVYSEQGPHEEKYYFSGVYFQLTANLDMSNYYWQPIGTENDRLNYLAERFFAGNFDGGNHTISNIITPDGNITAYSCQGLFGWIEAKEYDVTIKNVNISNSTIYGNWHVGAVVGRAVANNGGNIIIENCSLTNTTIVGRGENIGGIVGYLYNNANDLSVELKNCNVSSSCSVQGNKFLGGIVGHAQDSGAGGEFNISACENYASVLCSNTTATDLGTGGIVGYSDSDTNGEINIIKCKNFGKISSRYCAGGIVGRVWLFATTSSFNLEDSFNSAEISYGNNSYYQGGCVARIIDNSGTSSKKVLIARCYNVGALKQGAQYVGGIIGYAQDTTITNCYNTGYIRGLSHVGGVVGSAGFTSGNISITNCYNTGSVISIATSTSNVGGVLGYALYSIIAITNCYNTGDVSGSGNYVGGVVGYADYNINLTNCYNTGSVSGSAYVGGVMGYASASSTTGCNISKSANFGDITVTGSSGNVGGIVGYVRVTNSSSSSKMTNCYSEGSITVSGTNVTVGGFVGNLYADYSTYSNVKIEFCSVDLDIIVSGGSIASQGAFYGGTNGLTVENSYSLLTKSGTVSKVISDVSTQMDNNFGYMLNFKEGKPIPLGIFHILDVATRTGIVNRINAL